MVCGPVLRTRWRYFCKKNKKMYILHFVGSLSNYLVLEKEFVRKLPDELSFEGKYSSRSGNWNQNKTQLFFVFCFDGKIVFFLFEGGATLPYVGMVCWDLLVSLGGLGPYPSSRGKTWIVKIIDKYKIDSIDWRVELSWQWAKES